MADPVNPTNPAGGPPTGGGSGNPPPPVNPPIDPGVLAMLGRMEEFLKNQAVLVSAATDEQKKLNDEFKKGLKASEDLETLSKKIFEWGKKRERQNTEELRDKQDIRKELEEVAWLYEQGAKAAGENSKEGKVFIKNLAVVKELMKDISGDGKVVADQMKKFSNVIEAASRNTQGLVKAMQNLGRTGASLKGLTGILGALGIGKGLNRNIERNLEKISEVRDKVKESRAIRTAATKKHMKQKRDNAVAEAAEKGINLGGGPQGDKGRRWLAEKVFGSKNMGTRKVNDFMAGEASKAAGGDFGVAHEAALSEGGGAIEAVMSGFETGIEGLLVGLEAVAGPLTLLIAAIELLVSAFDTYVKQNQAIEKNLGKTGIFNQPNIGGGEAFARARLALMPPSDQSGLGLGETFERNVELAGAFA